MHKKKMGTAIEVNGNRKWEWFSDYDYDNSDFEQLGENFEGECLDIKSGIVGNAICKVFYLRDAVDFSIKWIEANRFMN